MSIPAKELPLNATVVTGVSRGIGAALADELSKRGQGVIGTARYPKNHPYPVLPLDVSDDESIDRCVVALPDSLDVLINNAGTATLHPETGREEDDFDHLSRAEFANILEVNVVGTFLFTRAVLPRLLRGRRKIIVNISSNLGRISANKTGHRYAYRSSKAALNMVTRTFAMDFAAQNVICIAWHPGWVRTDMGGPGADLAVEQSAADLADFLGRINPSHNGQFFDRQGHPLEW